MKIKAKLIVQFLIAIYVAFSVTPINAACLSFPFSSSDWNSQGKNGGSCKITSPFGGIRTLLGITRAHQGIDFSCKEGTPIRSIISGMAEQSGFADGGWHVVKQQSPELNAQLKKVIDISYLHSKMWAIGPRQSVQAGDVVSYLGNEGRSTGAHLHLQTYSQNPRVGIDPYSMACAGWSSIPSGSDSVISSPDDPGAIASSDVHRSTAIPSASTQMPSPPPQGIGEDSSMANLYDVIGSRTFNPEYIIQLGSLEEVGLYRELSYLRAVAARMDILKIRGNERREAIRASMLALQNRELAKKIEVQKKLAVANGNSNGR